jgi:uncharacterized protein YggE
VSRILVAFFALALAAFSQTPGSIQASGSAAILGLQPDQAQVTAGVTTSAKTAQDAATKNAALATAIIAALKGVLGSSGSIQTISYTLNPQYSTGSTANPPVIVGYTATNTVQATTGNLNLVGPLIDAANQAGANNISGPSFSLQNPEPYRQQALTAAAKQALAHAGAIAAGLGAKTGAVISAQEASNVTPVYSGVGAPTSGTPVVTGTVSVSADVTVTVALVQ